MSGKFIIESFCFGNITNIPLTPDDKFLSEVIEKLKQQKNRTVKSLWCLVVNIKKLQTIYSVHSLKFINFIREVFKCIDVLFPEFINNRVISFDNPLMVKVFILNELLYCMDSVSFSGTDIDGSIEIAFNNNFSELLTFIHSNSIMTTYDVPYSVGPWTPRWTISYKENYLSTNIIDIYNDNFIFKYNIRYSKNMSNILEKIYERLCFLKNNTMEYYDFLTGEDNFKNFTEYVFNYYPYSEVMDYYLKLLSLHEKCYLPDDCNRLVMDKRQLMFSILPTPFSSYILGFPISSIGVLSKKQILDRALKLSSDVEYFDRIKETNRKILELTISTDKVGNNTEGQSYLNNLFIEVDSYNRDDITILASEGFLFMFNYPEYKNIVENGKNPYNRNGIELNFINNMRYMINEKNNIIREVRERGLKVQLLGNMEENYEEVLSNINENLPETLENNPSNFFRMLITNMFTEDFSS